MLVLSRCIYYLYTVLATPSKEGWLRLIIRCVEDYMGFKASGLVRSVEGGMVAAACNQQLLIN
jgi:hypothetical protein